MSGATWQLAGNAGQLSLRLLGGRIDLSNPAGGLGNLEVPGHRLAEQYILGVQLDRLASGESDTLVDRYQREGDLVAVYAQTATRSVRVQLYWRASVSQLEGAEVAGVELMVSVQTSLLQSNPAQRTATVISAGEVMSLADREGRRFEKLELEGGSPRVPRRDTGWSCLVYRPQGLPISYAEMVHPVDYRATELRWMDGQVQCAQEVFAGNLEKGVILRARIRGMFLPREHDERLAAAAYAQFAAGEPPLTT